MGGCQPRAALAARRDSSACLGCMVFPGTALSERRRMTRLSVNVNKVATLRNTRTNGIPSVVAIAKLALDAGAHGITVHPRPDQRHIRPADVIDIAEMLKDYPRAEYNIEGNPFENFAKYAAAVHPTQC